MFIPVLSNGRLLAQPYDGLNGLEAYTSLARDVADVPALPALPDDIKVLLSSAAPVREEGIRNRYHLYEGFGFWDGKDAKFLTALEVEEMIKQIGSRENPMPFLEGMDAKDFKEPTAIIELDAQEVGAPEV